MASYLLRRALLFLPTLIGATFIIFMLMAAAPISIVDVLLPPGGEMNPGARAEREAYIMERYGLDRPYLEQYVRWLNNVSPIGFHTRNRDDPEVRPVLDERRRWRQAATAELQRERPDLAGLEFEEELRRLEAEQGFSPLPGDVRFDRLPFKAPDLGYSFVNSRPSWEMIRERLPVTIMLNLLSLPTALTLAILSGILAAYRRGGWQDWGIGTILLALSCIPVIWVGVMLIGFLANDQYINAFPAGGAHAPAAEMMPFLPSFAADGTWRRGFLLDHLWHLALPVLCLSYGTFAYYSKLTRASLLETLGADFVRTARAKGLPERVVLFRHAFRNALIPLITVMAVVLPALVTGSIVVETIFSLRGLGELVFTSLYSNDRELFLSAALITLLLQLLGFLIADIAYVVADPRVSYDAA